MRLKKLYKKIKQLPVLSKIIQNYTSWVSIIRTIILCLLNNKIYSALMKKIKVIEKENKKIKSPKTFIKVKNK